MKKRIAGLLAVAMMAASLAACGSSAEETTAAAAETEAAAEAETEAAGEEAAEAGGEDSVEGKKLLFFAFQNIGDYGTNDLGYYAAQEIAEKHGVEMTLVEGGLDASTRTTTLLDAIETGGYDYVISSSWYIQDDLLANVGNFPDMKFILYDTAPTLDLSEYPNVFGVSFRQDEGSFLTAIYQCLMTESNHIGAAANQDSPILNDFVTGWLAGVKYYNDNMAAEGEEVEDDIAYYSDQTVQGCYETVNVLYGNGCDVVYNIGGSYCLGALQACTEAGGIENGKYLIGVDYDQWTTYANSDADVQGYENLVTSMEKRITECCVQAFDGIVDGSLEMGNVRFGIANNGVGLSYNDNYYAHTPEDVQEQVTEVENKIKNGEIVVPSYYDLPDYETFAQFRDDPDYRLEGFSN